MAACFKARAYAVTGYKEYPASQFVAELMRLETIDSR